MGDRSALQGSAPPDGLDLAIGAEVAREGLLGEAERHEQACQDGGRRKPLAALNGRECGPGDARQASDLPLRLAALRTQAPDGIADLAGDALATRHGARPPTRRLAAP